MGVLAKEVLMTIALIAAVAAALAILVFPPGAHTPKLLVALRRQSSRRLLDRHS